MVCSSKTGFHWLDLVVLVVWLVIINWFPVVGAGSAGWSY